MTRTSREVIQVFFVKLIWLRACLLIMFVAARAILEAWAMCYFIDILLPSSAHAAILHYTFPVCARTSRKQCFLCRRRVWWGGRAGTGGGGEKPLPPAAFVALRVFGLTSKRPSTAATCQLEQACCADVLC